MVLLVLGITSPLCTGYRRLPLRGFSNFAFQANGSLSTVTPNGEGKGFVRSYYFMELGSDLYGSLLSLPPVRVSRSAIGPAGSPLEGSVVRLTSLSQRLYPTQGSEGHEGAGQLCTDLAWELSCPEGSSAAGRFVVEGEYKLNTKGDLELTHSE